MSVKMQHEQVIERNPLDSVEDIFINYDWTYDRSGSDELVVQVAGEKSHYTMIFIWQEEFNAMQFSCLCDVVIPESRKAEAAQTLRKVNEEIWLGHFEITGKPEMPRFRYTMMCGSDRSQSIAEQISDLMDIAVAECERHYDVFSMIAMPVDINDEMLSLALTMNMGKA